MNHQSFFSNYKQLTHEQSKNATHQLQKSQQCKQTKNVHKNLSSSQRMCTRWQSHRVGHCFLALIYKMPVFLNKGGRQICRTSYKISYWSFFSCRRPHTKENQTLITGRKNNSAEHRNQSTKNFLPGDACLCKWRAVEIAWLISVRHTPFPHSLNCLYLNCKVSTPLLFQFCPSSCLGTVRKPLGRVQLLHRVNPPQYALLISFNHFLCTALKQYIPQIYPLERSLAAK